MAIANDIAPGGGGPEVPITVLVDTEVLGRLEQERLSMAEPDLQTTVRRRLESSGRRLAHFERHDLLWSPPLRGRRSLHVRLSADGLARLKRQADRLDLDESILLAGVLSDDLFASPLAIINRGGSASGYLRTERGRGRIYAMRFEVAGYQYAFLKTIAGENLTAEQILELAITCLAERIAGGDAPSGLRLSREALTIAAEFALGVRSTRSPRGR
jgi:hypothetical protein